MAIPLAHEDDEEAAVVVILALVTCMCISLWSVLIKISGR